MRGTSHIEIGEVAGMRREIMVRNVVFVGTAARRDASPHLGSPHHVAATERGHPGAAVVVIVMEAGRHAVTQSVLD